MGSRLFLVWLLTSWMPSNSLENHTVRVASLSNFKKRVRSGLSNATEGAADDIPSQRLRRVYRPVVVMHGLGQDHLSLRQLVRWIREGLTGIHIRNLEIGNGKFDSYFLDMNKQVQAICNLLKTDPKLARGINVIGVQQGALLMRAYVQRCNSPAVFNYISLGGPQAGVVRIPTLEHDIIGDRFFENGAYDVRKEGGPFGNPWSQAQTSTSIGQYWKDPKLLENYKTDSLFLADINNERHLKNSTYKRNLMSLNGLVLLKFADDKVIRPCESQWFGTHAEGSLDEVTPLRETDLYHQDWIGLRQLDRQHKLHFVLKPGAHLSFNRAYFHQHIIVPYLNNTMLVPTEEE